MIIRCNIDLEILNPGSMCQRLDELKLIYMLFKPILPIKYFMYEYFKTISAC